MKRVGKGWLLGLGFALGVVFHANCRHRDCAFGIAPVVAQSTQPGAILFTTGVGLGANETTFNLGSNVVGEGAQTIPAPRTGVLANLFLVPGAPPLGGSPTGVPAPGSIVTATVRVNGADTGLAVTFTNADGAAAKGNLLNTVAVNQGERVTLKFAESGGVSPGVLWGASFELR